MRKLFLTFDTEDFISDNSILALQQVLESLKRHDLEALFFITGHMAERLQNFPIIVDLLSEHQIGYHSSSHSVHPTIFEFTDVKDYEEAFQVSLQRETAHINPSTGEIEGRGGIHALEELFGGKQILAFRAPGLCWTPPHLEALKSLGIEYDFSARALPSLPANYKNITFYPPPIFAHWQGRLSDYRNLSVNLLKHGVCVVSFHPSLLVNQTEWDLIFKGFNPKELVKPHARDPEEIEYLMHRFDLLLRQVKDLQRMHMVKATPRLERSRKNMRLSRVDVENCYRMSMRWHLSKNNAHRFLHNHFLRFFETGA